MLVRWSISESDFRCLRALRQTHRPSKSAAPGGQRTRPRRRLHRGPRSAAVSGFPSRLRSYITSDYSKSGFGIVMPAAGPLTGVLEPVRRLCPQRRPTVRLRIRRSDSRAIPQRSASRSKNAPHPQNHAIPSHRQQTFGRTLPTRVTAERIRHWHIINEARRAAFTDGQCDHGYHVVVHQVPDCCGGAAGAARADHRERLMKCLIDTEPQGFNTTPVSLMSARPEIHVPTARQSPRRLFQKSLE